MFPQRGRALSRIFIIDYAHLPRIGNSQKIDRPLKEHGLFRARPARGGRFKRHLPHGKRDKKLLFPIQPHARQLGKNRIGQNFRQLFLLQKSKLLLGQSLFFFHSAKLPRDCLPQKFFSVSALQQRKIEMFQKSMVRGSLERRRFFHLCRLVFPTFVE